MSEQGLPDGFRVAAPGVDDGPWLNRLHTESSPYLLQHANDPVDWRPWGPEAFAEARRRDVPVFLSIGYAACHWCHVMAHESFADPRVAARMNADFVSIKVDREERPDVDALYIEAMQRLGAPAGWPASLWLDADGHPFQAGTYYPPTWRYGTPAFGQVLDQVVSSWRGGRDSLMKNSRRVVSEMASERGPAPDAGPGATAQERAIEGLDELWDDHPAGWGMGARFPMPPNIELLLRHGATRGHSESLERVGRLLQVMDRGGIHDHLAGGFHRYTVDSDWEIPHFEKMLYDNAQLLRVYAEAAAVLERPRFGQVARDIAGWLERELTAPEGAYWSSLDADTGGEEGRSYVWERHELEAALGATEARRFADVYQVREYGNFEGGGTVLTRRGGVDPESPPLRTARTKLLAVRNARPLPAVDDKIVVAWNGLAIGALARAARLLAAPELLAPARRVAAALEAAWDGQTLRRTLAPDAPEGVLEDYAFLAEGLLDLFEATGDPAPLLRCEALCGALLDRFAATDGALHHGVDPALPARRAQVSDGAEPSGYGRALTTLLRLRDLGAAVGEDPRVDRAFAWVAGWLAGQPAAVPSLVAAWDHLQRPAMEVVIASEPDHPELGEMLAVYDRRWRPQAVLARVTPDSADALADFRAIQGRTPGPRGARAYVCEGRTCGLPASTAAALARELGD